MTRFAATLVLAALALPACSQPAPPTQPVKPVSTPKPAASEAAKKPTVKSIVTGVVKAPAGIIGPNGGQVIPTGGGNVVGNAGGNVIPTGGGNLFLPREAPGLRRLLAVTEAPLANAAVFLADAAGNAYPNVAGTTTDAQGRFTLPDVPPGFTVTVVVRGYDEARKKDVTLQTIVKTSELGASTSIDTASSLVTLAVLEGTSEIGDVNAAAFRTATEATARSLTDADVPDLSDRTAILAKVEALAETIAELKAALTEIREDLSDIKASIEEINDKLGAPQQQAGGFPPPPPRPGAQQPPPGGQPPPRGGQQPPAGCEKVPHELVLTGTYRNYPLRLDVLTIDRRLVASVTFEAAGAAAAAELPDVCDHLFVLRDASGTEIHRNPPYAFPAGSPRRVELPF